MLAAHAGGSKSAAALCLPLPRTDTLSQADRAAVGLLAGDVLLAAAPLLLELPLPPPQPARGNNSVSLRKSSSGLAETPPVTTSLASSVPDPASPADATKEINVGIALVA